MKKMTALWKKLTPTSRTNTVTYTALIAAFIVLQILSSAGMLSRSFSGQLVPICVYISMAVSLNLVVGISGELSLGHAGFMSVGAFSGVIAAACMANAVPSPVLRLILAMLVGAVMAAIAGLIVGVPVLRLRGDYLAIVTLAFGEVIKTLLNDLYVGLDGKGLHFALTSADGLKMENGVLLLNGPMGATGIKQLSSFAMGFVLVMLTLIVVLNIISSRHGRAIMATRDNRIAADSIGISVTHYKLMAFVIAAALAGMAGALYAMNYSTVAAKKFDFNTSILVLVFVVLGGMGNIRGSVIAAAILTILPELLRPIRDYRMLVYAIVLILVMLARNNEKLRLWVAARKENILSRFRKTAKKGGR